MKSTLCWITLGLWIVTIGVAGWFFVQGWTTQGTDGRMQIVLAPAERDLILGEMRMLLKAVHGLARPPSGLSKLIMGTVTQKALTHSKIPVVVYR